MKVKSFLVSLNWSDNPQNIVGKLELSEKMIELMEQHPHMFRVEIAYVKGDEAKDNRIVDVSLVQAYRKEVNK